MQIPAHSIATIQFTPLDHEGNPSQLDGPLAFSLLPGSEQFVTLLESPGDNLVDLRADAVGVAFIVATGDVLLDSVIEPQEWTCEVSVYEKTSSLGCEVVGLRPIQDEV